MRSLRSAGCAQGEEADRFLAILLNSSQMSPPGKRRRGPPEGHEASASIPFVGHRPISNRGMIS